MLTIDGSDGGGQILRTAVALSALAARPVKVTNIRAARPKPGLQPQHLLAVKSVAALCGAEVRGAGIGSREIEFTPGALRAMGEWSLDVGTAGSVMLLLQSLLPCLALAPGPSRVRLTGGTNNPWAPPFEYFARVFLPAVRELGVQAEARLERRGFYPRGGGVVEIAVQAPTRLRPFRRVERGALRGISGIAYSSSLPEHIVARMSQAAAARLAESGYPGARIEQDTRLASAGPGCGIVLFAEFAGGVVAGDALGERGKPAEKVGREAPEALLAEIESGAPVDHYLGDQLVVWCGLAEGESEYIASRATAHLRSAVAVTEAFLDAKFTLDGDSPVRVHCSRR
jgi:RNA 3'-terminal phosphate cyclase (ATP)